MREGVPDIASVGSPEVAEALGDVLRHIRVSRLLSLRQVTVRSHGAFKPSSIASYERAERRITVDRLFALASLYHVAPEHIVAEVARRLETSQADGDRQRRTG
jgi:transcriptional regulator with XRE-family HTH domain